MQYIWKDIIRIIFDFDGYIDEKFAGEKKKIIKVTGTKFKWM